MHVCIYVYTNIDVYVRVVKNLFIAFRLSMGNNMLNIKKKMFFVIKNTCVYRSRCGPCT